MGKLKVKITVLLCQFISTVQNRPNLPTCDEMWYTDLTICLGIVWDRSAVLSWPLSSVNIHLLSHFTFYSWDSGLRQYTKVFSFIRWHALTCRFRYSGSPQSDRHLVLHSCGRRAIHVLVAIFSAKLNKNAWLPWTQITTTISKKVSNATTLFHTFSHFTWLDSYDNDRLPSLIQNNLSNSITVSSDM